MVAGALDVYSVSANISHFHDYNKELKLLYYLEIEEKIAKILTTEAK